MKIGIDISLLCLPKTGVGHYRYNLVKELLKQSSGQREIAQLGAQDEVYLYGFNYRLYDVFGKLGFEGGEMDIKKFPNRVLGAWWNFFDWPKLEKFVDRCDVYHLSETGYQPSVAPAVATIHDLTIEKFPELHMRENKFFANRRHKRLAESNAHLIAVSESTKMDFVEYYGVDPERISVVYHGVGKEYRPDVESDLVKAKYGIEGPYILYLGTIEPRKNLERVLKAYREVKKEVKFSHKLVLAGGMGWGYEKVIEMVNEMRGDVVMTGYVPDDDRVGLMCGADCFVYASLYEGFGLPVLEAMACGVPVVTSENSAMKEIAEGVGILVDPMREEDIARGILGVLNNKKLSEEMVKKGLAKANNFSWEKCAAETRDVYTTIARE